MEKMTNIKKVEWVLRVAVAGEFFGHGTFAVQGKKTWVEWFGVFGITDTNTATKILLFIGLLDIIIAFVVLLKPIRLALLWATFWGFWTALLRPIVGEPIGDFVERWPNWGAPLALLLILGWPKNVKEFLTDRDKK